VEPELAGVSCSAASENWGFESPVIGWHRDSRTIY
jgi:hypothetical protein